MKTKILYILRNIAVCSIIFLAIFMMVFTIISVSTFNRTDRSLFGYKAFIVLTDSMKKTDFDAGDLIFIKEIDPDTLCEGDIISYISQNSYNYGEVITHKIRKLTTDKNGQPGFITYGTTTDTNDEAVVTYSCIIGKYTGSIPNIGIFFQFIKSPLGYFLCIFLPFLILILLEGKHFIRLIKQYKTERILIKNIEKDIIAAKCAENELLKQELLQLKKSIAEAEKEISLQNEALSDS